jgi:putative membrane protein
VTDPSPDRLEASSSALNGAVGAMRQSGQRLVYLAAERTLLMWVRTAATLMVLGFVVERFGLFLSEIVHRQGAHPDEGHVSLWFGGALVWIGVVVSLGSALRFRRFARRYEEGDSDPRPGLSVAVVLGFLLAVSGAALGVYLLTLAR